MIIYIWMRNCSFIARRRSGTSFSWTRRTLSNYRIEHISEGELEPAGQLPDVLDVVDEDTYQMNNESDSESN